MKLFFITTATKMNMYSSDTFDIAKKFESIAILPIGHRDKLTHEASSLFSLIVEFDENHLISSQFKKYYQNGEEVRIISMSEEMLLEVSQLRDEFDISGMRYKETLVFRDKYEMKRHLNQYQIPMSSFVEYDNTQNFEYYSNHLGFPFIIKPRDAFGAEGFYKITSEEVYFATKDLLSNHSKKYIAERFIEGQLFHCESIVKNKEIIFSKVGKCSTPAANFQKLEPMFYSFVDDKDAIAIQIKKFNQDVLKVMPLENGVTHHEMFVTPDDQILFLEIAARTPGALLIPQYQKKFGINLLDISFLLQMGMSFDLNINETNAFVATGQFPLGKGLVKKLNFPDKLKSKFHFQHRIQENDKLDGATQLRDIAADIILESPNRSVLEEDIKYLSTFNVCEFYEDC